MKSFKEYLLNNKEEEIREYITEFLYKHSECIIDRLYKICKIGEIDVYDFESKSISVEGDVFSGLHLNFIVEADIRVVDGNSHNDDEYEFHEWFNVSYVVKYNNEKLIFKFNDITIYTRKKKNINALADDMLPKMNQHNLDEFATNFLFLFYPQALKKPMPVSPEAIVHSLSLKKIIHQITSKCDIFGQVFFRDAEVFLYDDSEKKIPVMVEAGTIIIDPHVSFLRNEGALNNTIIHECVHWYYHRNVFEFFRIFNKNINNIECKVEGGIRGRKWTEMDTIEWQANSLTPRIQMPEKMFSKKAQALIEEYKKILKTDDIIDVIEPVIEALAQFFVVSKMSAKIRMIDIGYEEARGAFIWLDNKYVPAHKWKKGFLDKNETFSISFKDAANLKWFDYELRKKEEYVNFIFLDNHYVLNDSKYVYRTKNDIGLTKYARNHMDECCLVFKMDLDKKYSTHYYTECFFNRDKYSDISYEMKFRNGKNNIDAERKKELLIKTLKEQNAVLEALPNNYPKAMAKLLEWRSDISISKIAKDIDVADKTVDRVIKGQHGSIEKLVGICLSMQLPYKISEFVIDKSPWSFDMNSYDTLLYNHMLETMNTYPMDVIWEFCNQHNLKF